MPPPARRWRRLLVSYPESRTARRSAQARSPLPARPAHPVAAQGGGAAVNKVLRGLQCKLCTGYKASGGKAVCEASGHLLHRMQTARRRTSCISH
eukprot:1432815-Pleurochrysis_carterae.AAC.2